MLFLGPLGGIRTHTSCFEHWNLNPARLPVSPRGVVSPRLTLGDSADVSALCQFEEEFLILDVADKLIENIDVFVQSVNEDRVVVGPLLALQLITQQLHTAHDEGFLLVGEFYGCLFSIAGWYVCDGTAVDNHRRSRDVTDQPK